ncbi:MAG: AMP-binding protein [Desulfovibrio sp.]|jgi:4-coumarate--CoA ligase (photoactive yellow protein activation family)|nr:AMP-binding protein [Desulfovibrio sp.]
MDRTPLTREDVCNLLRSILLFMSKGQHLADEVQVFTGQDAARRKNTAGYATRFFGLEAAVAERLFACPDFRRWADIVFDALCDGRPHAFNFSTSGSTGVPRYWSFTAGELEQEAQNLAPFFTDRRRVVSVMPLHHVFGFAFALMLPKALGIPVLLMPPLPTANFFRELRSGDMVLGFPLFWKSVLGACTGDAAFSCPPNLHGVTSAAPCPPELIEELSQARPAIVSGMTEIYGATEFGAVGIRRNCRGPYALLGHFSRVSLSCAPDAAGETAPEWGIKRLGGKTQPLPDEVEWLSGRNFLPVRRKDTAVQVGGRNVFPSLVAELLSLHPKVRECAVRLMRPEEGMRLKAFVVLTDDAAPFAGPETAGELREWLHRKLYPEEIPRAIRFGRELPRTPSGKSADWDISDPDGEQGSSSPQPAPSADRP